MKPDAVRQAWDRAGAARWGLSADEFGAALGRALARRFESAPPSDADARAFVASLHLPDLALACACSLGRADAWEHFVREYRPVLLRIASSHAPADAAREVADSLYAELFGLEERGGARRSLFDYYHGRSALASWLRAVIGQRLVDRARAARRTEPLPEPDTPGELRASASDPDVDRGRLLPLIRRAFHDALAGLEPKERLRLSLYYTQDMTLAAIGRVTGESEATVSRKLDRSRRGIRDAAQRALQEHGLTAEQVIASFDYARTDPAFDLARALPPE